MRYLIPFLLISLMTTSNANGAEEAYARTAPGQLEIKTLPAGRLLEHKAEGGRYFDQSGSLFRPLFSYIQSHDIAMTTPVEARMEPGTMYFWVSKDQEDKADNDDGGVRVVDVPERTVAAIGVRGAYSEKNFDQARTELLEWLAGQQNLVPTGEPFAAYWNGPFTPWFLKTFEVLVQVRTLPETP
jgi:hypothetical protein